MVGLSAVATFATFIELLYENRSLNNSYCNIPRPAGPYIQHTREFHKEFLIPTSVIPQEFFLENIQKKSNLSDIEIFEDFVYYQKLIYIVCKLASDICIRFVFFPISTACVSSAINMFFSDMKRNHEVLTGIVELILSITISGGAGGLVKIGIKLGLVLILLVFGFGKKTIIWGWDHIAQISG